tara:strand:+ start:327 stop:668 length:342 start_codon:yes stop_codon:yes gene_type:complete
VKVESIRAFIPCKDYEISKAFYTEIGFIAEALTDHLTLLKNGNTTAFLQRFYDEALAQNFMLQVCVSDIVQAHKLCSGSIHKQKISDISSETWGKVFYLWGPSGELLHITQLS